jgi:hypothetical protein
VNGATSLLKFKTFNGLESFWGRKLNNKQNLDEEWMIANSVKQISAIERPIPTERKFK